MSDKPNESIILPLQVMVRPDNSIEIQRVDGVPIAVMCYSGASLQNAYEIVRRVNCYDALVTGCQAATAYLTDPRSKFKTNRDEAARLIQEALDKANGRI